MLVLSRKQNETIRVDGPCTITVLRTKSDRVRLGIDADPEHRVVRGELKPDLPAPADAASEAPVRNDPQVTFDLLTLVLADDELDACQPALLAQLTDAEREELCNWAADCHLEACGNDLLAPPAPACLRRLLPAASGYHAWRMPPAGETSWEN